jgi:membrane-associated phospholipid phosphatase
MRLPSPTHLVLLGLLVIAGTPAIAQTQTESKSTSPPGPMAILKESARDLTGLASWDSFVVLGGGAGAALAAHVVDDDVNWQLAGSDYRFLDSGQILGHASVQSGIAVATYLAGRAIGADSRAAMIGQQLIRAQIVTQLTTLTMKTVAHRERPDGSNHRSFPSGHASTTFAAATILSGNFGWRITVPAYLVAAYVATSRLHENHHYLSDVVFGSALGVAAGRVTLRRDRQSTTVVQPAVLSGGAGLIIIW